jgi:hypothetical protein
MKCYLALVSDHKLIPINALLFAVTMAYEKAMDFLHCNFSEQRWYMNE